MIKDTHETNPSLVKERLALKTTKLNNWEPLTQPSTQPKMTGQLSDDLAELLDCLEVSKITISISITTLYNFQIYSCQPIIK